MSELSVLTMPVYNMHLQFLLALDGSRLEESTYVYITDRSKAILLLWFYLFYVLESNVCAV